jgi:cholesterol transport system auxiliary component
MYLEQLVFKFVRRVSVSSDDGKRIAPLRKPVRKPVRMALLAASTLMLAACGGSAAVETFNLTAPDATAGATGRRGQLIIMEPVATAPYTSDRLVVTTKPGSVAYLKGAQWSDQLPVLLQTRILQTFENSRRLRAVARPGEKLVARLSLNSEIRRFDIDVESNQAVIELSVKLINDASGQVLAARIFKASVPSASTSGPAAAAALDQALGILLRELVPWSARRV